MSSMSTRSKTAKHGRSISENGPHAAKQSRVVTASNLPNPHLSSLEQDFLYHIGYSRPEIRELFHDVKFVIMGGSAGRMGSFAEVVAKEINHPVTSKEELSISRTDRFAFFKIGPVLSISHGMGVPSITICLHEMMKLCHYAGATDAIFIRIGTSGGIGVPAGTLVITNRAFNGLLREEHEIVVLGERKTRPSVMDQELVQSVLASQVDSSFNTIAGATMCTDDFFEGQGRLDGAVCEHTEDEKMAFLRQAHEVGVVNIEMECAAMAALCSKAGYRSAVVCVTLLDRLNGDQVTISPELYKDYSMRPQKLVASFIKSRLETN